MQPTSKLTLKKEVGQYTLKSLIHELKKRAADEPQDSLVEWLYLVSGELQIRMRYDEYPSAKPKVVSEEKRTVTSPEPIKRPAVRGKGTQPSQKYKQMPVTMYRGRVYIHFNDSALQEKEPPAGGKFDYLTKGGSFVGRIILSCDWRNVRRDAPLGAECNGAVIDARTWRPLVIPPRAFTPRYSAKVVNSELAVPDDDGKVRTGPYDIIQVSDGTVVTLYNWDHPVKGPIWCLSSSNGYDVSHLKWMGDKTYSEIVHELLSKHPKFVKETGMALVRDHLCENDVRLTFKKLDNKRCYTIGFRHPNFHPMKGDPPAVWNIQSTDLVSGKPEYLAGLPHVPRQALYSREDIIRLATSGGRKGVGVDGTGLQLADLAHISRTALDDAKAFMAGKAPTVPPLPDTLKEKGIHVCKFNYGFILRARDPAKTAMYPDILCESPLLRRVRYLIYRRPSRQVQEELNEGSRLEYSAIKAFLTPKDRDEFLALFPSFKPRFVQYQEFVDNVIHLIISMQRHNAMTSPGQGKDVQPRTSTKTIAKALLKHITTHGGDFIPFHKDAHSIVRDYVVRPEYAVLYLRAIGLPKPAPPVEVATPPVGEKKTSPTDEPKDATAV
jgi:hypothetical protein